MNEILRVNDLTTRFFTSEGQVNAVEGVSFDVQPEEIYGIVGESGSGKSVTVKSLMGLVKSPGRVVDGEIWLHHPELADKLRAENADAVDGKYVDLTAIPERARQSILGSKVAMVFQDPTSNFNPTRTIGEQIGEAAEIQRRMGRRTAPDSPLEYSILDLFSDMFVPGQSFVSDESMDRAIELLELVDLPDAEENAAQYPHELSGGMLQRAMVALALAGEPDLLLADEPTTGLDVTIEAQILSLLDDIQSQTGMSIVLITHDLGLVSRMCDRVAVMYAGQIVERGRLDEIFENHVHPYTRGLMGSVPDLQNPSEWLEPIEGNVPDLLDAQMPNYCYFADRCPKAMDICKKEIPDEYRVGESHTTKCYLADEEFAEGELAEETALEEGAETDD